MRFTPTALALSLALLTMSSAGQSQRADNQLDPRSVAMVVKGDAEYALHFNETDVLTESQQGYVEAQLKLFDAWYADWAKQPEARKYAA